MNGKACEGKRSWPTLRYYFHGGTEENHRKRQSQEAVPDPDLYPGLLEYGSTQPRQPVTDLGSVSYRYTTLTH
jgi:hypothetical protein